MFSQDLILMKALWASPKLVLPLSTSTYGLYRGSRVDSETDGVYSVRSFVSFRVLDGYHPTLRLPLKEPTWTVICSSFLDLLWILVGFVVRNPQKELQMGVQVVWGRAGVLVTLFGPEKDEDLL